MEYGNDFERIVPENLFESGKLKVLICYVLFAVAEPVPATELAQLFHYDSIANYFDVQSTISELEEKGCIVKNSKGLYIITDEGSSLSDTLKESVSISLRNRVYNSVIKMLARYKADRDTSIEITRNEVGCKLSCRVTGAESELISFSIQLPNEAQALALKAKILEEPKFYYDSLINILTAKCNSEEDEM